MNSIKSSEYNPADNYDYPEFIAIKNDEQRTPDEGFDNSQPLNDDLGTMWSICQSDILYQVIRSIDVVLID